MHQIGKGGISACGKVKRPAGESQPRKTDNVDVVQWSSLLLTQGAWRTMHQRLWTATLLALLHLSVIACGGAPSASNATSASQASTSTTARTAAFPGSYATPLTADEITGARRD